MPDVVWVSPSDLDQWSNRRDAQARLPMLVRRLVFHTIDAPHRNQFRAEEGVGVPGWDGIVEVQEGNQFVPPGRSAWELGTGHDPRDKANEDYRKRTEDPKGVVPSETCFIFVTSRLWRDRDDWQQEKRAEKVWRDVRAYDADDLAQWLEIAPAVRSWAASQMRLPSEGVSPVEDFWDRWAGTADPALTPGAILAGRSQAFDRFREWLSSPASTLPILAESDEEALIFGCAALMSLSDDLGDAARARTIVVSDDNAWRTLSTTRERLVMLPDAIDPATASVAARYGHHVLFPVRDSAVAGTLALPRLHPDELAKQLEQIGLSRDRASAIARGSGRRATVLRRTMSPMPAAFAPPWAAPAEARPLISLLLAGAWNDGSDGDREVLQRLTVRPYSEVVDTLARWANEADPPFHRTHDVWGWVSREDSWRLLARFLVGEDLRRFENVALEVLGEPDPRNDLPRDDRWMAGVRGALPRYSSALKEGLAESVALLGASPESAGIQEALGPSTRALVIVRRLLHGKDWRAWATLSGYLCHLAEAAPDTFLDAVDSLSDENARLLFEQEAEMGGAPHTGVLWALETLAWEPQYLSRVALVFGRLARLDPGGRLGNRPPRSLRTIFLGWHPQTCSTLEQRFRAVDALLRREPDAGWQLLMDVMPRWGGDSSDSLHRPRWRDWASRWAEDVPPGEYADWVEWISNRAVADAGDDGMRWAGLIEHVYAWPSGARDRAIESLEAASVRFDATKDALPAWKALRDVLHHHRSIPEAEWSMPLEVLNRLEGIYRRLEPADPVHRFGWLFASWPNLPEASRSDWRSDEDARDRAREEGARAILDAGGLDLALDAALTVDQPHLLGWAIGTIDVDEHEADLVSRTLGSDDEALRKCGLGFVSGRFVKRGWEWADEYLSRGREVSDDRLTRFACALPFEPRTWDAVSQLGEQVEAGYWREVNESRLRHEEGHVVERGVLKLLGAARPYAALAVASASVDRSSGASAIRPEVVARVLEEAARVNPSRETPGIYRGGLSYEIQRLFIALSKVDFDASCLARLEFAYLPLLERGEYDASVLERELSTNPSFFADVMELVYRASGERESAPVSEDESARAHRGYQLLQSWKRLPGTDEQGRIHRDALTGWVREARRLCEDTGRLEACDRVIGQMLAHAPADPDSLWPTAAVRDVLEATASGDLEHGLEIGITNKRGVYSKAYDEGGKQERSLSEQYEVWASRTADAWPRTAAVLRKVARSYRCDARREDEEAQGRLDR